MLVSRWRETGMSFEVWAMTGAGLAVLVAGLWMARTRFQAACGWERLLVLGPVFEAVALAMFAMEHFTAARDLVGIVPKWLPGPLFWTYFVGAALMAAAVSLVAWRCVRWSALLLALFFLLVVALVDLPGLPAGKHDRFFWILTVREMCFAGGAMVLAGSAWTRESKTGAGLMLAGRCLVGAVLVFYGIEHFLHPRNVDGVPLELMTPKWMPWPVGIAWLVGVTELVAGFGLLIPRMARRAAAGAGLVLLVLTLFFYGPIFVADFGTKLEIEGINYLGDTLLFAATVLLAGLGGESAS
jgi:uncharacterized membrane protein